MNSGREMDLDPLVPSFPFLPFSSLLSFFVLLFPSSLFYPYPFSCFILPFLRSRPFFSGSTTGKGLYMQQYSARLQGLLTLFEFSHSASLCKR